MDKEFELASEIVRAIINNQNIEVRIHKNSEEVGIIDKCTGAYMLTDELVYYLTTYLK